MKRYLSISVVLSIVLATALLAWAQERGQGRRGQPMQGRQRWQNMSPEEREQMRQRWQNMTEEEREKLREQMRQRAGGRPFMDREAQLKAIAAIEEQVAKLKAAVQTMSRPDREQYQQLSEEERNKLREKMRQTMRDRQQAIAGIEEQLAALKGPRQMAARQTASIGELKSIHELAVKEDAKQTAQRLERLIARYQQRGPEAQAQQAGQRRPRPDRPRRDRPARGQEAEKQQ